jgi:flagellar biosynthesis/type III secretory pathway chaperone
MNMDLLLDKLSKFLEGETDLYRSLLSVLQNEKEAVVDSDLKRLNETSKEKENLLLKIKILGEQRLRTLESIAASFGYSPQDLTLIKLSQLVGHPYSSRLKECHSNLFSLIQSIQEINHSNRALIMNSIELVRGSLVLLNNLIGSNQVYYRTGEIQVGDQNGRVVSGRI